MLANYLQIAKVFSLKVMEFLILHSVICRPVAKLFSPNNLYNLPMFYEYFPLYVYIHVCMYSMHIRIIRCGTCNKMWATFSVDNIL